MRERLTYANVMATLGVFIALGGTGYAAASLKKGQVKARHIAKDAVTAKKVKDGSLHASDFKAGHLPAGPKGDPGAPGRDFTVQTKLAPGETLTGTFVMAASGDRAWGGGTFRIPLANGLDHEHVHVIAQGDAPTETCPGQGQAARGHLCVYSNMGFNLDYRKPFDPRIEGSQEDGAAPEGFGLSADVSGSPAYGHGTWAVTAP